MEDILGEQFDEMKRGSSNGDKDQTRKKGKREQR